MVNAIVLTVLCVLGLIVLVGGLLWSELRNAKEDPDDTTSHTA